MRNLIALTILLAGCSSGVGTHTQGLTKQRCVTTITCPDGGVLLQSFDYTSSDSNDYDGGTAVFVPPGGSGGSGCGTGEIYICDGGTSGSTGGGSTTGGGTTGGGTTGGGTTGGGTTGGSGPGGSGSMGNGNGGMSGGSMGNGNGGGLPPTGGLPGGCMQETTCTPEPGDDADGGAGDSNGPGDDKGCWITGGGYIIDADGNDSFGGNAMPMKDGSVRGQWEEQDHGTNDKGHGQAQYIVCRHVDEPGPGQPGGKKGFTMNQAYFGGPSRWYTPSTGWQDGYWFDVFVEDHGEGHGIMDYYHYTIRDKNGVVIYDTESNQVGGNIQLHPPNAGHPSSSTQLPPWVSYQP